MTEKNTGDLHIHLNGSFSLDFLKKIAAKNDCIEKYEQLERIQKDYFLGTNLQPENGFSEDLIGLVWKQFGLVHNIIQNLNDISEGVIDVVQNSKAKYLEIRTTPKLMADSSSIDEYINVFESGLLNAKQKINHKKAVGLLSLDRTIHTLEDAKHFINRILTTPHNLLVGLDISGNPLAKRTLTGKDLEEIVYLALNSGLAITIHMGEVNTEVEQQDSNIILSALEQWKSQQPAQNKNPLHGKVRIGHCIFLTEEQKEKISNLAIPIEVCPSCHRSLNWHLDKFPHPVTEIYKDLSDPIVVGTDDKTIFGATIKAEFNRLFTFFSNKNQLDRKVIKEHQAGFRFSR